MTVPAKHRDALSIQCEGRITLTRHPHGCLLLFPRPIWEAHREQIARELIAIYDPSCNVEKFDQAWKDEWIGDYETSVTEPLTTRRDLSAP